MIYGFDTDDEHVATAALMVYSVWRSRNTQRYKVTPDVWGQIERFTKSAAKRAQSLAQFLEALKPRLYAETLSPRAMQVGVKGNIPLLAMGSGAVLEVAAPEEQREFLVGVIERANQREVLRRLYRETAYVILLVRDRLEREKPLESRAAKLLEDDE